LIRASTQAFDSFLFFANRMMTRQTISKFVSVGVLGAFVVVFGVILLGMAASLFIRMIGRPGVGGFAFSVSRGAFTAVVGILLALITAGFLLIARALYRRYLH
jgi:hypothetical protein